MTLRDNRLPATTLRASISAIIISPPRHQTRILIAARLSSRSSRYKCVEARIKQVTGGDLIAARFMRQDVFEFKPEFKLLIAGNHRPSLRSVDEAIRRRFHLLPFDVTILPAERDRGLTRRLQEEAPAILAWAIESCLGWRRQGLDPPRAVTSATAAYLSDEDAFETWLDDEEIRREPTVWHPSAVLFASWRHGPSDLARSPARRNGSARPSRRGASGRSGPVWAAASMAWTVRG